MLIKTAVAYARYSSDKQQESSIVVQIQEIKKYCAEHKIELIHEYIDEAQTGTNANRKSFQQMIADSTKGEFDMVIVHRMDRMARNVEDALHYKKYLAMQGVRLVSVIESFDESPEGDFFKLISMGMAELYSKKLARECVEGQLQNAKEGNAMGGYPPLGYEVKGKRYIINEDEAKIVRLIFNMVVGGYSYREIKDKLNWMGLSYRGRPFTHNLHEMLRNRKYIGEYVYNRSVRRDIRGMRNHHASKAESEIIRIPDGMPRIIDDETFNKVQLIMDARIKKSGRGSKKGKYILSGLLVCGVCGFSICGGTSYGGRNKHRMAVYRCGYKNDCPTKSITCLYLDNYILRLMRSSILNEANHRALYALTKKAIDAKYEYDNNRILSIRESIKDNEREIDELKNSLIQEHNTSIIKMMNIEIQNQIDDKYNKEFEIANIRKGQLQYPTPTYSILVKKSNVLYNQILSEKNENINRTLSKIIERITIDNDTVRTTLSLNYLINSDVDIHCSIVEIRDTIALKPRFIERRFKFEDLQIEFSYEEKT